MKYRYLFSSLAVLGLVALVAAGLFTEKDSGIALPAASGTAEPGRSGAQSAPDQQAVVQEGIRQAMDDYKYNMQFPPYSVPIESSDWHVFNPRALSDQPMTIMDGENPADGPGKVQVSVVVDKGIVDVEHDLPVRVSLAAAKDSRSPLQLSLVDVWINPDIKSIRTAGEPAVSLSSSAGSGAAGGREFRGSIPASLLRQYGDSDVYLVAGVTLSDGSRGKAFIPIRLFKSKAAIASIGKAYVEGAHLMIPFELLAHVPGGFNVRANLLAEKGGVPIALLSESLRAEGPGLLRGAFRVHIATLKEKGDAGPYVLANIHITKTLTKPDYQSGFGEYDELRHAVSGFGFDQYSDETYVDEAMQRRLQGLERMVGSRGDAEPAQGRK